MKIRIIALFMVACSAQAMADCQLISSQTNITYGRLSAAERQIHGSNAIELPEKQITLNVTCDVPQRIRLFVGSSTPAGSAFGFGEQGSMSITAENAVVDNDNVRLAVVQKGDATVSASGTSHVALNLNQGIAFIDGQELVGKTASLTLKVIPQFKSGPVTERATYRGNIQVKVEAQ